MGRVLTEHEPQSGDTVSGGGLKHGGNRGSSAGRAAGAGVGGIMRDEDGESGQLIIHYGFFHSFSSEAPVALAQPPKRRLSLGRKPAAHYFGMLCRSSAGVRSKVQRCTF